MRELKGDKGGRYEYKLEGYRVSYNILYRVVMTVRAEGRTCMISKQDLRNLYFIEK